jgi:hypothetical protein
MGVLSKKKILKILKEELNRKTNLIIGVDGFSDSGKTTFVKNFLQKKLQIETIFLDDYLIKNKGAYFINLRIDNLKQRVSSLSKSKLPFIIEGVCLLKILKEINITYDVLIYIKRTSKTLCSTPNLWRDEDNCTFAGDIDEWEKHEISQTSKYDSKANLIDIKEQIALTKEIVVYHQIFKPHKNANIIYCRIES